MLIKTDVITDILCVIECDELRLFQNEFHAVISALKKAGVDYCLIGDVAISEYTNPFATTELEIQLLHHSVEDMFPLLSALNLQLGPHEKYLKIVSRQPTERDYDYCIYLHDPVPLVKQHYQIGNTATVFGLDSLPVADIHIMIWYQLFYLVNDGRKLREQYKGHLLRLFESQTFDRDDVTKWLLSYAEEPLISRFNAAINEWEHAKQNPGLSWGEVQKLKRKRHEELLNSEKPDTGYSD